MEFENCVFEANRLGPGRKGGGGYAENASVTLRSCIFRDNSATYIGGGIAALLSDVTIEDCAFYRNTGMGAGGGASLAGGHANLKNCTFSGNACGLGGRGSGLYCSGANGVVTVTKSIIAFNLVGGGLECGNPPSEPTVELQCCDIYGNTGGDWIGCIEDQYEVNGNISEDPLFCDAEIADYHIYDTSPCASQQVGPYAPQDFSCGLLGAYPVGCEAPVIVVRPDGTGDYPTIQEAIDAAPHVAAVELTDGEFTGNGNRDLDFRDKAITVRSQLGDPSACIINCEGTPRAPHRGFLFNSSEGLPWMVTGVGITNGYIQLGTGGGILCSNASPRLIGCAIFGNATQSGGGGISCISSSQPRLLKCTLHDNEASQQDARGGGLYAMQNSWPRLYNCTFARNGAAYGGGLCCASSSQLLIESGIVAFGTDGEAVYCEGGGVASLSCCNIFGNAGGDWVGCIEYQYGQDGNFTSDPLFCDAASDDFTLNVDSPCLPGNDGHPSECGVIGAWPIGCPATGVGDGAERAPQVWLGPCIPNPFTALTEINYRVSGAAAESGVRLRVFDATGRLVRDLFAGPAHSGLHRLCWDGTDRRGMPVQGGVYFCRLRVGDEQKTRQMLVMR